MSQVEDKTAKDENCKICDAQASTSLYGIMICSSCRDFFNHTIYYKVIYKCDLDENCEMAKKDMWFTCEFCRYKKCLNVGLNPAPVCQVCHKKVETKFHYGALVCGACHLFFKLQREKNIFFKCVHSYRCITNQNTRLETCIACHYEACLKVGMWEQKLIRKKKPSDDDSDSATIEIPKSACTVCGNAERTTRVRYGGLACNPCGCFFQHESKMIRKKICNYQNKCLIDQVFMQRKCIPCRYEACLRAGMLKSRIGRRKKKEEKSDKKSDSSDLEEQIINPTTENSFQQEIIIPKKIVDNSNHIIKNSILAKLLFSPTENFEQKQNMEKPSKSSCDRSLYQSSAISCSQQEIRILSEGDIMGDNLELSDLYDKPNGSKIFKENINNTTKTLYSINTSDIFDPTNGYSTILNKYVEESEILSTSLDINNIQSSTASELATLFNNYIEEFDIFNTPFDLNSYSFATSNKF